MTAPSPETPKRDRRRRPSNSAPDYLTIKAKQAQAETRFKEARAELNELRLAVERGEYHATAECKRVLIGKFLIVRSKFLALPRELPPHLEGLPARQIGVLLDKRVREILTELSEGR